MLLDEEIVLNVSHKLMETEITSTYLRLLTETQLIYLMLIGGIYELDFLTHGMIQCFRGED